MIEAEVKFRVTNPDLLAAVSDSALIREYRVEGPFGPHQFLARYYDTPDGLFETARCSFRSRRENNTFRAAFKEPGSIVDGLSRRVEYEADLEHWFDSAEELPAGPLKSRVLEIAGEDARFETRVVIDMQRSVQYLELGSTRIELVTDAGEIRAGNRSETLFEIELELKRGDQDTMVAYAQRVRDAFDLVPSTVSKHEIGLALYHGKSSGQ